MAYPNFKDKHKFESLLDPEFFVKKRIPNVKLPRKCLLLFQSRALKYFKRKYRGQYKKLSFSDNHYTVYLLRDMFVFLSRVGSPATILDVEELSQLGAKEFLIAGYAGGLTHQGIFLCDKAIRDEGTSHHYLPNGKYSFPDKGLMNKLRQSLVRKNLDYEIGTTWTIDAPYRETKKEIASYRKEGVVTVEMESSALFALGKVKKLKTAAVFVVSDVLGDEWEHMFDNKQVKIMLGKIVDASIDCLRNK